MMFKALLLEKTDAGFGASVQLVDESRLPEGDVLVGVEFSTLNYKDGLAITNTGPVVRSWPMVAGIDGAGVVIAAKSDMVLKHIEFVRLDALSAMAILVGQDGTVENRVVPLPAGSRGSRRER